MSYFRRIIVTALVLLMILAACSSSPEVPPDFGTEIKGDDFNGVTLTFLTDPYVCYDPDSLFGDLAKARVADVCKKYNVNIEFNEDTDIVYDLILCVSSGIKPCDVLFGDPVLLRGQMRAGVMFPVDTFETGLDYLDSEKWGGREQLMGYAWNGHLYGVCSMLWPETVYRNIGYFFYVNENIISRLGQPDPREFVENGEWTRSKYEQILEDYTHQNNNGETVYARTAMPPHYFSMAIKAGGVNYIVKQPDGSYKNAYLEPGAYDKIQWAYDSYWNNYGKSITHGTDTFTTIAQFVNGDAVMVLMDLYWGLRDIQYSVESFGLLPFPLSDDLTGSKWIGQFEDLKKSISFPANITETEAIPTVVNAIFEPLDGYETADSRYEYYNRFVFHDERDTKVVFECLGNCRFIPYYDNGYHIPNVMGEEEGKRSLSQILESNAKIMDKVFEEVYIPIEQSCDQLWGE